MSRIEPLYSKETLHTKPFLKGNSEEWVEVSKELPPYNEILAEMKTDSATGKANLALLLAAPKLHDLVHTMIDRLESILSDEDTDISSETGDEIRDIINNAWEVLNADGNLLGIAKYSELE